MLLVAALLDPAFQVFQHGNFQPDNARFTFREGGLEVDAFDWGNAGYAPAPLALQGLFNGIPHEVYREHEFAFFEAYCAAFFKGCGRRLDAAALRETYNAVACTFAATFGLASSVSDGRSARAEVYRRS